jgi:hypothetical protein
VVTEPFYIKSLIKLEGFMFTDQTKDEFLSNVSREMQEITSEAIELAQTEYDKRQSEG